VYQPPSVANIAIAAASIDPVFCRTPQYRSERLSALLGCSLALKIETLNPIGSFKGRGASWWMANHRDVRTLACVSAGNFGQAMAYVGRARGVAVHVFTVESVNPAKLRAMIDLGAQVHRVGDAYPVTAAAARAFAAESACPLVVDGKDAALVEGAGSIAVEWLEHPDALDVVYVPVGDGALANGIGLWIKAKSPRTRVVGVCAEGAPAMVRSWREGRPSSTDTVSTIADGIAVNEPVAEAVALLAQTVDDLALVADEQTVEAMRAFFVHENLVTEPSGAIALAAAARDHGANRGKSVGVLVSGANIDPTHKETWLWAARTPRPI
jgi:threonine dehydratase